MGKRRDTSAGTPATTALTRLGLAFEVHPYDHDPAAASYGLEAAAALSVPPAQVFKTLLVEGDRGLAVGVVPVDRQLDLKAVAAALGLKKVAMAQPADAERRQGSSSAASPRSGKEGAADGAGRVGAGLRRRLRLGRPPRPRRLTEPGRPGHGDGRRRWKRVASIAR